jgi:hypothetical protein
VGKVWQVWQTFSDSAVDLRLDSPEVIADIGRHLDLLASVGVWGVRLDAPAYYAKHLGEVQRHHPEAYALSRKIVDMALERGLTVLAQLDCDDFGCRYFPYSMGYSVPIVDYAYAAHLGLAILQGDPSTFAQHVRHTWSLPCAVIRPPRTHDGILMRSKLFDADSKRDLIELSEAFGLEVRVIDGDPYEVNASLPYLYRLGVTTDQMLARVELSVAVTAFVPGWPYYYLPAILGYVPEDDHEADADPRSINRQPVSYRHVVEYVASGRSVRVRDLLRVLGDIVGSFSRSEPLGPQSVETLAPSTLVIRRNGGAVGIAANFSVDHSADIGGVLSGRAVIRSSGLTLTRLGPLGYCVWK